MTLRDARVAADDKYCEEQIAKVEAEYRAKGYDKIMSMDEAEEHVMRAIGPLLDLLEEHPELMDDIE